jgi:hypothetical protein
MVRAAPRDGQVTGPADEPALAFDYKQLKQPEKANFVV